MPRTDEGRKKKKIADRSRQQLLKKVYAEHTLQKQLYEKREQHIKDLNVIIQNLTNTINYQDTIIQELKKENLKQHSKLK